MLQTYTDKNGICQITLNRPQSLNALNRDLLNELDKVVEQVKVDSKIKALLITGQGEKAFCAGADINRLAELNQQTGLEFAQHGQAIFRKIEQLGKPSLAAINGYAFGGGCELAMATSLRIASENAIFGQPEVKLGVLPGYGGTQRLARLVGKGRAIDLCITGRTISAAEALQWGLVSEVTLLNDLLDRATAILIGILSMAPLAVKGVLSVIDEGYDLNLDDALDLEAIRFSKLCDTKDRNEGVAAFIEKRKAVFRGR